MKKVFKIKNLRILLREIERKDIKRVDEFLEYINLLVKENAMILINRELTRKEEKEFLLRVLENVRKRKEVIIIAEDLDNRKIAGIVNIEKGKYRQSHVGILGISVRKEYRGIGLGKILMKEVIKLAKKRLKIKLVKLDVFENNKIAINLYKKVGFKIVGRIPKMNYYNGKFVDDIVMIKEL